MAGGAKRGFGMPLLGKELREQAARKGTYVARVVYAVLLFSAFLIGTWGLWGSSYHVLGRGGEMLAQLVAIQFCGIYLFLPAMMSRTIAEEKEKETLVLLFLTDMGPWELLLQKYLGRLIPMFCFLLLSLPLMAIAYAFGGISASMLGVSVWMVFLCCLQTGAFALMCSAYCQTPAGAFLATYVGLAVFYGVPVLVGWFLVLPGQAFEVFASIAGVYFPPWIWLWSIESGGNPAPGVSLSGVPVVMSVVILLLGARWLLVRRAFGRLRNPVLAMFGALDRIFGRWNAKMGGFTMWKGRQTLPVDDPVAWREQQKRGIGRPHYLCRLGLLIMVPTVLIGMGTAASGDSDDTFMPLMFVGWSLSGLAMVIQGANLIAVERSRQTMEVLLTTPMAPQEIVRQKMRALWRFGVLLAVPLLTLAGIRAGHGLFSVSQMSFYIVSYLLAVPLLFILLAWVGMWVGLRVQSRGRAIVVALVVLVAWCGIPPLVASMLEEVAPTMEVPLIGLSGLSLLSPAASVFCMEASISDLVVARDFGVWFMWAGAAVVSYGILAWWLRRWCLENADRLLGAGVCVWWSRMDCVWAALLAGMFVVGVYLFLAATRIVWELPGGSRHTYSGECVGMLATGWALLAMAMAGKGASVVAGVRFWRTIDAVAGTPLAAREILRRKMRVLLGLGTLVPALGIALVHFGPMVGASGSLGSLDFDWTYLLSCLLAVPLLLFSTWSGMWIGLRMKLRGARWLAVLMGLLFSLSPAGVVYMLETGSIMQVRDESGFIAGCSVVLVVVYGLLAWRVRRLCLENADRLLRGA